MSRSSVPYQPPGPALFSTSVATGKAGAVVGGSLAAAAQTTTVHRDREVLERLAEPLDRLAAQTGLPVTARRTWLSCWLGARPDLQVLAVTVARDDVLVAAAVLAARRRARHLEVVPAGAGASDELRMPAVDAQAAEALAAGVVEALCATARRWRLVARDLTPGDPVTVELQRYLPHAYVVPGDASPRLTLGEARDLRAYVSRNHHQQSRRLMNRLQRAGRVDVAHLSSGKHVAEAIDDVVEVCRARDHDARGRSELDTASGLRFFRELITEHAARGQVRLTTLRVDGRLAAYVLCFVDGGTWRMWNCRFHPHWASYGPGRLAHDAALGAALAAGATTYDWMRGEESYKSGLSDHTLRAEDLYAASTSLLWLQWRGARRARALARSVRDRSPAARTAWRWWRSGLRSRSPVPPAGSAARPEGAAAPGSCS